MGARRRPIGPRRARRRLLASVVISSGLVLAAGAGLSVGAFGGWQAAASDQMFPSAETDDRVVVVGIDRATLGEVGVAWPWPRHETAGLLEAVAAAGPGVVVVDLSFPAGADAEADAALADALAAAPTVLAFPAEVDRTATPPTAVDVVRPGDRFVDAVTLAHAAAYAHPYDGVVRSLPLVLADEDGAFVPALSLAALMAAEGEAPIPTLRPGGVQVGERFVPTGDDWEFRLNFGSGLTPEGAAYVSAVDVLSGAVGSDRLGGRIVFVGVTEPTLGDQLQTPIAKGAGLSGVFVQAQATNTMLTSSYLDDVGTADTLLTVAFLGAVVGAAVLWLPLWASTLATIVIGAANFVVAFVRFDSGDVVNLVYTTGAVGLGFVAALAARFLLETRQQRRVEALFSRYVPEGVADELVAAADGPVRASPGERVVITVLFCDLRGFTAMSEGLEPAALRDLLDEYYAVLVELIHEHGGTVLNFVGDEVFAVWGAPVSAADHEARALACALDVLGAADRLNATLTGRGMPAVTYGIGLNSGEAVAGHVGNGPRLQYTVLGDTVNVGARLCSVARPGEIVCTSAIHRSLDGAPPAEPIGDVTLKGVSAERELVRVRPPARAGSPPP